MKITRELNVEKQSASASDENMQPSYLNVFPEDDSDDHEDSETKISQKRPFRFLIPPVINKFSVTQIEEQLATLGILRVRHTGNHDLITKSLLKEADLLFQLQRFPTAIKKITLVLNNQPNNVDALSKRALYYAYASKFSEALSDIQKALELDPKHLRALINYAIIQTDIFHDDAEAERSLRIASQISPKHLQVIGFSKLLGIDLSFNLPQDTPFPKIDADSWFMLGLRHIEKRATTAALSSFDKAIKIDQNHLPALLAKANLMRETGDVLGAIAQYDYCLTLSPENIRALFGLGSCYFSLEKYEESRSFFCQVLLKLPGYVKARFLLSEAQRKLCYFRDSLASLDYVVEFCENLIEYDHPAVKQLRNRNMYLLALSRRALVRYKTIENTTESQQIIIDECLKDINTALSIDPKSDHANNVAATIYLFLKNYEKAQHHAENTLSHQPKNLSALVLLGRILRAKKEYEKAEKVLKQAISVNSNEITTYYHLAGVYTDSGNYECALDTSRLILSIHNDEKLPIVCELLSELIGTKSTCIKTVQ